jgi:hypothetical protein
MTSPTDEEREAESRSAYRVPRLLRPAELLCADGRALHGRVFLPAVEAHPRAVDVLEWLEEAAAFFPFLPDGEGRPVLVNKRQVLVLTVFTGSEGEAQPPPEPEAPRRRVHVDCGSLSLDGEVVIDMPADHSRVLDLLNRPDQFLAVWSSGRCHFVRKSGIVRLSDPMRTTRDA